MSGLADRSGESLPQVGFEGYAVNVKHQKRPKPEVRKIIKIGKIKINQ